MEKALFGSRGSTGIYLEKENDQVKFAVLADGLQAEEAATFTVPAFGQEYRMLVGGQGQNSGSPLFGTARGTFQPEAASRI